MQLQYLEILKNVGSSPSTKIVIPMELGGLIGGLQSLLPAASNGTVATADAGNVAQTGSGRGAERPAKLESGSDPSRFNDR